MVGYLNSNESKEQDVSSKLLSDLQLKLSDDSKNSTYGDVIKSIDEVYSVHKNTPITLSNISALVKEKDKNIKE